MCKHILITEFDKKTDMEIIKDFASMTYDKDGYGAMFRTKDNGIGWFKSLDMASFYLNLGDAVNTYNITDLVVHHRTSTNKPGLDYAHPFEFKGNYLTHNGVVTVPGKHDTNTTNDSEELLHHLIKTNYETKTVSGYFSCFIINKKETIVLVDDTAPIYNSPDERVYCSHQLEKDWKKLECVKLTLSVQAKTKVIETIEVTKSSYGQDKAYLSIGGRYYPNRYDNWDGYTGYSDEYWYYDKVELFFKKMSMDDEEKLEQCKTKPELVREIKAIAETLNLKLLPNEVILIMAEYVEQMVG